MLEDTLKLDYAGIIALEKETEAEYIHRGKNVLQKADEIKDDFDFIYRQTKRMPKKRIEFPSAVSENMAKVFGVNTSWMAIYRMKWWSGSFGLCCVAYSGGVSIPILFYDGTPCMTCCTVQHEAIHAVRKFVSYSRFPNFEEAMADYNEIGFFKKFRPSLAIRKAREKLEDKFGEKAGHVLIRLTPPEVYALASSKEPVQHLKEWGCLRHEIIRERLGL